MTLLEILQVAHVVNLHAVVGAAQLTPAAMARA
jgi:hypothetical protein